MGKEEMQKLNEMTEILNNVQSQINFLQVQLGSGGGSVQPSQKQKSSGGSATLDPKQLQAIEQKLAEIFDVESRNSELLFGLREDLGKLVGGKIESADERLEQVTRLLEQGLQLTEMGTELTEIRDKLGEVLVELDNSARQNAQKSSE